MVLSSLSRVFGREMLASAARAYTTSPSSIAQPYIFRNNFIGVRHGNSEANQAKIISSSPDVATKIHGLTPLGVEQVNASAEDFCKGQGPGQVMIVTSDFTRARMTAEIFAEHLGCAAPTNEVRLRERFFGSLDGGPDDQYHNVWAFDKDNADHTEFGAESVNSVIKRTTALVAELDKKYEGVTVLMVAHGDVIQILQTAFKGMPGEKHRSLEHLDTAKYRRFN
jgi:probable phosphoglycerate mutase